MARSSLYTNRHCTSLLRQVDKSVTVIKRMGKFDWCAVIEKQWCNLWKRQNVLSLQQLPCLTFSIKRDNVKPSPCVVDRWVGGSLTRRQKDPFAVSWPR